MIMTDLKFEELTSDKNGGHIMRLSLCENRFELLVQSGTVEVLSPCTLKENEISALLKALPSINEPVSFVINSVQGDLPAEEILNAAEKNWSVVMGE